MHQQTCTKSESYNPRRTSCDSKNNFRCNTTSYNPLVNTCDLEGVQPAILSSPYPDIQIQCKNKYHAQLLTQDYCGASSELTAITQYINHEIRISGHHCETSRILLAIAQAEMIHLQMLGELIVLLGHPLTYDGIKCDWATLWTPNNVTLGSNYNSMICADIDGEYAAIKQYEKHANQIDDPYIEAILRRIVMDEKYHISLLKKLLK